MTRRQLAFVIDLNKCIGCQACTVACKRLWTGERGQEFMNWCNVETAPGEGYPRRWAEHGGGFRNGQPMPGRRPTPEEYGDAHPAEYESRLFEGRRSRGRAPASAEWSANWDEDQGRGDFPNTYFFYLPRMCNQCSRPACAEACPQDAIFKRDEDGIVVVDPGRCVNDGACVAACPYGKVYLDPVSRAASKCIGCFPRIEKGQPPVCVSECSGRAMHVAFLDDAASSVHQLVAVWKVALPLRPDFETKPNVFYIPPFLGPETESPDGGSAGQPRVPQSYLEELFGPDVGQALTTLRAELAKRREARPSALMDLLIAYRSGDLVGTLV